MYDTEQDSGDGGLTEWLAARTQTDPEQIEAELQLGERRRAVVVDELVAAGLAGSELLEQVMGLTGLDAAGARALIAARAANPRGGGQTTVSKRDERLAQNEVMFRRVNERIVSDLRARRDGGSHELEIVCECSDRDCLRVLRIEVAEYEWLRLNPRRFAVLPGHEAPAVEDVVERHDRFVVVEKHAETHGQVDAADPRS
ncbi:MAG TPA: hypothetical protein VFO81_07890 [Gaiellaceae bacterium]|nr:hypothetical protein [Gaiellaceae bacterium]